MSRLYVYHKTDLSKTGKRGHQEIQSMIYFGTKDDSKLAAKMIVSWPKGSEFPHVTFETKNNTKIKGA